MAVLSLHTTRRRVKLLITKRISKVNNKSPIKPHWKGNDFIIQLKNRRRDWNFPRIISFVTAVKLPCTESAGFSRKSSGGESELVLVSSSSKPLPHSRSEYLFRRGFAKGWIYKSRGCFFHIGPFFVLWRWWWLMMIMKNWQFGFYNVHNFPIHPQIRWP